MATQGYTLACYTLRHSIAALYLLEAGRGIEYDADHLGHQNIRNTCVYAQITHPLRDQVFRVLAHHPRIVRVQDMDTNTYALLPRAELVQSHQLRQWNALWLSRAVDVRQESRRLCQHSCELHARYQQWRQRYFLVECAWCKKHIRWQSMEALLVVPATSHGICPTCFVTVLQELRLRKP